MASVLSPVVEYTSARYNNAAEWVHALGDIPLERIICDPWPGTATEADLLRLVERDCLCELIDGTLVAKPMGLMEAIIAANLIGVLGPFVIDRALGAVSGADSTLRMASTGRIRLPDVCFFSLCRLPKTAEAVPTLSPDLAVEVLSAGNTASEMERKLREYFASGTQLTWIIDPVSRVVAIYHRPGEPTRVIPFEGHLDGETVVPGFTMPVSDLFRNVPAMR
ncbi:MAG TPA: Uma2 family endonuclease [Tepidisphaeraceae bacterium]|nr:Uma2 family endonuclease [Tepidisphaeraceae bacterium]